MRIDPLRHRYPGRDQHGRPVQAVEPRDVLADHVEVGGPPALEHRVVGPISDTGGVVDQRVAPDVNDMLVVAGERNAPFDGRARDAEILQAGPEPPEDLVATRFWLDEIRVLVDVLLQPLLVTRQFEEVVLLLQPLRLQGRVD